METDDCPLTAQLKKYLELDQKGRIMAEYVWVDSEGGVRSKSRASFTVQVAGQRGQFGLTSDCRR